MNIEKIIISNFQCFGQEPVCIELDENITCLLGNNGAGKSSIIKALQRLFGKTAEERKIIKSDFHICTNETDKDLQGRQLYIDVWFGFKNDEKEDLGLTYFSSVIFQHKNEKIYARMRLEATWTENEYDDEVSSHLYWVLSGDEIEFGDESFLKVKVDNYERRQINLIVIPAIRDAKNILKNQYKELIKKLERYTKLSENEKEAIEEKCKLLEKNINSLQSIQSVQEILNNFWKKLHNSSFMCYQNVKLEIVSDKFEELIKSLLLKLAPAETAASKELTELSDGQISILYFALSIGLLELELSHHKDEIKGFKEQDYELPIFTIVALEEPENHLSSFYLSRILSMLNEKSSLGLLTAIITSHSPNVVRRMKRVEQIRFLRQKISDTDRKSIIKKVLLPEEKSSDDYKYIKHAILAHPELYFAKLVVLGEGDSEEIVLPAIAQKFGYDFDSSFVSFVPLGGRHVNHFWRLLKELEIPYITLLDYDLGRETGGKKRLKNIAKQLACEDTNLSRKNLRKKYNIFFSYPLDLDMLMISNFPDCYSDKGQAGEHDEFVKALLGKNGDEAAYKGKFFSDTVLKKYRYLFKTKSKVASHYLGCENILSMEDNEFIEKCPFVLYFLIKRMRELLCIDECSKIEKEYLSSHKE